MYSGDSRREIRVAKYIGLPFREKLYDEPTFDNLVDLEKAAKRDAAIFSYMRVSTLLSSCA